MVKTFVQNKENLGLSLRTIGLRPFCSILASHRAQWVKVLPDLSRRLTVKNGVKAVPSPNWLLTVYNGVRTLPGLLTVYDGVKT